MSNCHHRNRRAPRFTATLLLASAPTVVHAVAEPPTSHDNPTRRIRTENINADTNTGSNPSTKPRQSQINLQRPEGRSLNQRRLSGGIRRIFYRDAAQPDENVNSSGKKNESRRILLSSKNKKRVKQRLLHDFTKFESAHRLLGGAFNPNLENFDPHGDPTNGVGGVGAVGIVDNDLAIEAYGAPESFVQCPPGIEGNRASYDCTSYVYCLDGQIRGTFHSCMGLFFDNERSSCDWEENVTCEKDLNGGGGNNEEENTSDEGDSVDGQQGAGKEKVMASALTGANAKSETEGGDEAEAAAWNGGSDWGGAWVHGVWVPDGEKPESPAQSPGGAGSDWKDVAWDPAQIVPFPPHPVLPFEQERAKLSNPSVPSAEGETPSQPSKKYVSSEGWSYQTREGKNVIGYYPSWQWYKNNERSKPTNMNFQKIDRVNFAFFQTDEDGNIWGTDSWADPITLFGPQDWLITVMDQAGYAPQFNDDNGFDDSTGGDYNYVGAKYIDLGEHVRCHRAYPTGARNCVGHRTTEGLIDRAHSQGAYVYPSIGGWSLSKPFPKMAADAKSRRNFAKNCVGLIREYGFDGIDVDWEYPTYEDHDGTPQDTENFILLLKDIRAALDAYQAAVYPDGEKTFGLTAALPCGPAIIDNQDVSGISSILDEMNLMTYDFHGTWDDLVGVNAPLYDQDPKKFESVDASVNGCVERWVRDGADKSRINIGLPFYGRSFGGAKSLYTTHTGADGIHWWADEGMPQYANIVEKLPEMITLRDDITKTQYAYFDSPKGGLVSFDDQQAICDKVEYARVQGLSGWIVWDMSGDLREDLNTPLLDVVNFKLQQGDEFDCELYRMESRDEDGNIVSQNAGPKLWYVSWEKGSCLNDGMQPSWMKEGEDLFRFKEECCAYKFQHIFDECVGPPTEEPTDEPSPNPTSSPVIQPSVSPSTLEPTHVFGAARVINSGGPTVLTARSAEETESGGPEPPVTWCMGGCKGENEICAGNQNHPQAIDDETCKACMEGQTYWPCDVDGLCFCWDPDTPRIPPAPASGLAQLSDERPCDYFTEELYYKLAPDAQHPYTYQGFCDAIDHYNDGHAEKIFMMGTEYDRKKELAMFLGHTLHESDQWRAAREYLICADIMESKDGETYCKPCTADEFNWETFKCDGVGLAGGGLTFNGYCDYTIEPPLACPCEEIAPGDSPYEGYIPASKVFFGRGAIQLSWNYNFRSASDALTGDPTTFCDNPDLVATEPEYAWGAGVFFWMENLKEETTCHIEALKNHDFGGTLNNINGGLECPAYHGGWHGEAIKLRLDRYCNATEVLELPGLSSFDGCKGLSDSFAECVGDGSCPNCVQFKDTVPSANSTSTVAPGLDLPETTETSTTVTSEVIETNSTTIMATSTTVSSETTGITTATTESPKTSEKATTTESAETTGIVSTTTESPQTTEVATVTTESPETTEVATATTETPETTEVATSTTESPETTGKTTTITSAEATETTTTTTSTTTTTTEPDTVTMTTTINSYDSSECAEGLLPVLSLPGCCLPEPAYLGDGACDPDTPYNTPECNFDNGDCCKETCDLESNYACSENAQGYGPFGYYCLDPDHSKIDPEVCNVVDRTRIGDGRCDPENNIPECDYDAGDCCEETCDPRYAYFECGDENFPYDCKNPDYAEPVVVDVPATIPSESLVDDTDSPTPSPTNRPIGDEMDPSTSSSTEAPMGTADNVLGVVFVEVSEDSTLSRNQPDSNFGQDSSLQLRGPSSGPNASDAMMRFVIPESQYSSSAEIDAVLRVYSLKNSNTGGIFHLAPEPESWAEDTVTWNNAPDWTTRLDNIGSIEKDNWYTIDISDAVMRLEGKESVMTIRARSRDPGASEYSSKEGGHPPEIMITYYNSGDVVIVNDAPATTTTSTTASSDITTPTINGLACSTDLHVCPDGTFVARMAENDCNFAPCPDDPEDGYGQYWPVWGEDGAIGCVDGEPPSWATGAYLKDSKSECCDAYFMLQIDACLSG
mmetsp:Transcript_15025/g.29711  ORF Transcript_15025/g.29711 Transcript_15025/m.29711 type:complete len:1992 (-) Transcript_15025:64-6039(-)